MARRWPGRRHWAGIGSNLFLWSFVMSRLIDVEAPPECDESLAEESVDRQIQYDMEKANEANRKRIGEGSTGVRPGVENQHEPAF
jgi:hypothetical protein